MCGGELVARADDTEESISKRLTAFHTQTRPVLDLFSRKELIVTVDGTAAVDAVQQEIRAKLRLAPWRREAGRSEDRRRRHEKYLTSRFELD